MAKLLNWLRHYLIPHHGNNHRAKLLHPSTLSFFAALFLVYQFGINLALLFQPSVLGFASNISPERVIELTNQQRMSQGLAPLNYNPTLSQAAQMKAGDMFAFNYWAHTSPSGRDPWFFFKEANYRYLYAGENLARDFMNPEAVVSAWMDSPTHRENILNSHYQEIGLAVIDGTLDGVETTLVVQLFGTPTPTVAAAPAIAPAAVVQRPTATPTLESAQVAVEPEIALILPNEEEEELVPEITQAPVEEEFSTAWQLAPATLVQANGQTGNKLLFSPFWLTKIVAIFLLSLILGVLALDVYLVYRRKIVRLSGKNLAHLIFIAALLLSAILTTQGAII